MYVFFLCPTLSGGVKTAAGAEHGLVHSVLSFTCTNEYDPVQGAHWPHLAEPHRQTTFEASSTIGDPYRSVFTWTFADNTVLEGRYEIVPSHATE